MICRNLWIRIILRVIVIVLLSVAMGWVLWVSRYPHWAFVIGGVIVFFGSRLVHDMNATNRLLSQFFSAVRDEDSSLRFPGVGYGKPFAELSDQMELVNGRIQDLRMQIQQKEIESDAIIENAEVGIICYSENGMVKIINRKGRELLGVHHLVSIKALLKTDSQIVELFERLKGDDSRILKTRIGNRERYLAMSCSFLNVGDSSLKLISFTDIKNELDAAELESWQKLINVLTHEIMNSVSPMTSLTGTLSKSYSQINQGDVITQKLLTKTRMGLQVIGEQGDGLMKFVQNYRRLSRVPKPRLGEVNVKRLFDRVKLLVIDKESSDVEYLFSVDDNNLSVMVDESQLVQVLTNLIKNAQYAISDSGVISVWGKRLAEEGVCIGVEDNGIGIAPEVMKEIFVPFFTTRDNGSGIGLSLARQIIRNHGGKIHVESQVGKGTKVEIGLP